MIGQVNPFQHWDLYKTFSLRQAAMLWAGMDPNAPEATDDNLAYIATREALKQAIVQGHITGAVFGCNDPKHPYAIGEPVAVDTEFGPSLQGPEPPTGDEIDWENTHVSRRALARYARRREQAPPFLIKDIEKLPPPDTGAGMTFVSSRPAYTTPLLEHLYAAIDEFWVNHDEDYPPLREEVIAWLSERIGKKLPAEAIDLVIRSEASKKGGKPKLPRPTAK